MVVRGSGSVAQVSLDAALGHHSHTQRNWVKRKITKSLAVKSEIASSISHEHTLRLDAFRHLVNLVLVLHYWFVVENPWKVG